MNVLIHKTIEKVKKDSFIKGFSFLLSGTVITQVISFALSPILTRLYSPSEYGVNAVFLSLLMIFTVIATLRLQVPIAMSDNIDEKKALSRLIILSTFTFSCIVLLIVVLFRKRITLFFNLGSDLWLWMLPISIFFSGVYEALYQNLLSSHKYKAMAKVAIIRVVSQSIFQILLSFAINNYMGLILGNLLSYLFSVAYMNNVLGFLKTEKKLTKKYYLETLRKNFDFVKYACPAELTSIASYSIVPVTLTFLFTSEVSGYYSLSNRLIGIPISLFGDTIRQVFIREASTELSQKGSVTMSFLKATKVLAIIAIPSAICIFIISPTLFSIFFGRNWANAGLYTQAMIFLFLARFIVVPITSTVNIIGKQKIGLFVNVLLLISIIILTLFYKYLIISKPFQFLFMFSIVYSFIYFVFYYVLYKMVKKGG